MKRFWCVVLSVFALPGFGQTPEIQGGDSGGFFASITKNYRPRRISEISFEDSPRLDKLMRAGRIYLSLRDAIALALENNLDIENARISPRLADANVLRASAGQLLRNFSNNITNGPSSASLGISASSNSLGASSVGSGGSGGGQTGVLAGLNVQLAGSSIPNLDPVAFGFYQASHTTTPLSSTFVTGTNYLVNQFQSAQFGVQKGFITGTNATLGMNNTLGLRQNSPTNDFNPTTSSALSLQITQNLLQGFSRSVNSRAIRVAHNQRIMSDLTFKQQIIATVTNVVNLYWDLVTFNENLKVRQKTLDVDTQLYSDNKRKAELGAIAEIDIVQAEAEMKSAQQDVTTAETQVLQQEMILKSVLTRSGLNDLTTAMARIVPTDHIDIPAQEAVIPVQDLVAEAITNRPEIEQNRMSLENARINMLGTKNALLPTLQAFVNLANNAQAGDVNTIPVPVTVNGVTQYITRTPGTVNPYFLGGYGTVLGQLFGRNFPNYTVGLQLSVPLRNRSAQADLINDELSYRQSQIQDRQLHNNIKLNVVNDWVAVSQARSVFDTSRQARVLQDQTLNGERRKYELGSSTFLNVLIVQRDAVARELSEQQALNQYVHARINLEQVTGRILKDYNVDIEEAVHGTVKREPDLPIGDKQR